MVLQSIRSLSSLNVLFNPFPWSIRTLLLQPNWTNKVPSTLDLTKFQIIRIDSFDRFLFHGEKYTVDNNPGELKLIQVVLLRWVLNIFLPIFLWFDENLYFQGHHWISRYQCISVLYCSTCFNRNPSKVICGHMSMVIWGQLTSHVNKVNLKQGSRLVSKLFNPFSSESIVSYK